MIRVQTENKINYAYSLEDLAKPLSKDLKKKKFQQNNIFHVPFFFCKLRNKLRTLFLYVYKLYLSLSITRYFIKKTVKILECFSLRVSDHRKPLQELILTRKTKANLSAV